NPPGGVGREFVSASVFKLIDSSHQAGVAFLDQVETAQATVAVTLGNRHYQTEITSRKFTLSGVILTLVGIGSLYTAIERGPAFHRKPHQVMQLVSQLDHAGGSCFVVGQLGNLVTQGGHPP